MTPEQIIVQVLAAHWGADELDDEIVQVAGPVVVALREAGFRPRPRVPASNGTGVHERSTCTDGTVRVEGAVQ